MRDDLGVRWTIGDVNLRGFAALRLSVWGAYRLFGTDAAYRVYVNNVDLETARQRTGDVPAAPEWRTVGREEFPAWLDDKLDGGFAEGVAWKLVPWRAFPDRHELALDNDVILWREPAMLSDWRRGACDFLLGEDVSRCFGAFEWLCPAQGLNSGIRGLPPGFDLGDCLRRTATRQAVPLVRELDEQGLQVAALFGAGSVGVVPLQDVTICSPFPPHVPWLGRSGAHFVGLNTRRLGFQFYGRPAEAVRAEHWDRLRDEVRSRVDGANPDA